MEAKTSRFKQALVSFPGDYQTSCFNKVTKIVIKCHCNGVFVISVVFVQQNMSGQLGLLNIACAAKAKSRRITMVGHFFSLDSSGN